MKARLLLSAALFALILPACGQGILHDSGAEETTREGADLAENIPVETFTDAGSQSVDLRGYDYIDANSEIPARPLQLAKQYYALNRSKLRNQNYMTIFDVSKHSSTSRMFVIDMRDGSVRKFMVAHGSGSDPDGDGRATRFSNTPNSKMTSVGFYTTGGLYNGRNGKSLYLHGLESTNSNAYNRAIVMHGAKYVTPTRAGRSSGCPAIEMKYITSLLPQLSGGSLLYIHYNR